MRLLVRFRFLCLGSQSWWFELTEKFLKILLKNIYFLVFLCKDWHVHTYLVVDWRSKFNVIWDQLYYNGQPGLLHLSDNEEDDQKRVSSGNRAKETSFLTIMCEVGRAKPQPEWAWVIVRAHSFVLICSNPIWIQKQPGPKKPDSKPKVSVPTRTRSIPARTWNIPSSTIRWYTHRCVFEMRCQPP
jgi:hypothetical protein